MKRGSCNYVVSPLRHTDLESVTKHQGTSPALCHACIEPLYPPRRTTPLPRQAVHQPRKCFFGRSRWARARKIPLPPACLTARSALGSRSIVCCAGNMHSSYRSSFRTTQSRRTEPMTRDLGCKNCHRAGLAGGFGCCRCGGNDEPKQTSPQLWFQDRASRLAHTPTPTALEPFSESFVAQTSLVALIPWCCTRSTLSLRTVQSLSEVRVLAQPTKLTPLYDRHTKQAMSLISFIIAASAEQ
jgi:hypothetical protein